MIIIIMIRMFVNREEELKMLEKKHKKSSFECIVVYGRRRVGKTQLIKRFIEGKKAIYFLADKRGSENNLSRFVISVAEHFDEMPVQTSGFDDAFKYIGKKCGKKRLIIVFDEFSYLVEKDGSIPSVFQLIIDEILKETNIFLILCGSSISMMEIGVLSYKSPLYGRRTGQILLKPLKFKYLKHFFPTYPIVKRVEAYAILSGIPAYLSEFDAEKSLMQNIENTFLTPTHMFYIEPEMLLREELREPASYFNILQAIASGCTKMTEIANKARFEVKDIPIYINTLIRLGFVKKINPVTEMHKTKKSLYYISDNFFSFWFSFILENKSKIEGLEKQDVIEKIKKHINQYMGRRFEELCEHFLWEIKKNIDMDFNKAGKWWGYRRENSERKEVEIDLVCLDEQKREILFVECKWSSLTEKKASHILEELKNKSKSVEWNREKEYFGLFGKKILGKEKLRKEGFFVWDLEDIEKLVR